MRGFFSVAVVGLLIVVLLAVIYSQHAQQQSSVQISESWVIQQTLAKEWTMARNAYSQFASDAIARALDSSIDASNCPATGPTPAPVSGDFSSEVNLKWNDVNVFMQQNFDVNCQATISAPLEQSLVSCGTNCDTVTNNEDVYVVLTCQKTVNGNIFSLSHPFTMNKQIYLLNTLPTGSCRLLIADTISSTPAAPVFEIDTDIA